VRLADVNVLVHAFREDAPGHPEQRAWLESLVSSDESHAVSDHILGGFLRVVAHLRVFHPPTPIEAALSFVEALRNRPTAVPVVPGSRHWEIFTRLCRGAGATGNRVPDAGLAARAIEQGCEFVTTDRDYAGFPSLRWRHPLA